MFLLAASAAPPAGGAVAEDSDVGRPLAEVLREVASDELRLVFSSAVVGPELRVVAQPTAREPRQRIEQLLAPHGLTLRSAGEGVWVVVRRPGPPPAAGPQEDVEEAEPPMPYMSDEIVVRPSRLSLLHSRPTAAFSLGATEIHHLPHLGDDLFRTVSLYPGTASNDVSARFSIRGGRSDEVKIVLDGQELYDAYHLKDFDSALSVVPASTLAAAELSTGSYPVDQGDRMGGVLDLRTAEPPDGHRWLLDLGVLSALLSSSGSFGGGDAGWFVAVRRGSLDLAGKAIDKEDPNFWSALGKVEGNAAGGRLGLHVLVARDALELNRVDGEDTELLDNDYRSDHGWLTHRAGLGPHLLVETVASWADVGRDRGGSGSEEEGSFALRDKRRLEVLGLRQSWTWEPADRWRQLVEWGAEVRRYDAVFDYLRQQDPDVVILPPGTEPLPDGSRFQGPLRGRHDALWASHRATPGGRLTSELGLRWDHHTATGDELLSPRVNLAWRLSEGQVLRAAWGRFDQSQRPYELGVEDGERRLARAEVSEHRVLGYEAYPRDYPGGVEAVRVEVYQRRVDDPRQRFANLLEPINLFPEIEPDRVRVAPTSSRMEGVEVSLRGRGGRRVGWWLSYAWARAEDRLDGRTAPRPLDQRHTLVADLDVALPRAWRLNLAWRYHSGWPTTAVTAALIEDAEGERRLAASFGPLYGERLPAYHRLDARASRRWTVRRGTLTLYLDVQNLYDRANAGGFDLVVDEDEGTVRLEGEDWPGIFPSLGVVWEL